MKGWADRYEKLEEIGLGSSGKIYKVIRRDSKEVMAAKIISVQADKSDVVCIEQQVKIMGACNHPNVLRCLGVELFENEVWILTEWCEGGSLTDRMRMNKSAYKEEEIRNIMKQVIEGLVYLHSKGIIHRDVKGSNLLFHRGSLKIADFGVSISSKEKMNESKFSRIGSPYWMSPEVLADSIYNEKTDIWALGITAIELAEGEPPFSHQHPFRAIYSIQTHPPQGLSHPHRWSPQFNAFIKTCLTIDYKSRPTAEALLNQTFISKVSFFSIESSPEHDEFNESQNTIIMHNQIPKSIWEKESLPQSEEKAKEAEFSVSNTVVINEDAEDQSLQIESFAALNGLSGTKPKSNKKYLNESDKVVDREMKAKQLYLAMETEMKDVRRKYMERIRKLYTNDNQKQNKSWNSPVKKLKDRNSLAFGMDTSQMRSKML